MNHLYEAKVKHVENCETFDAEVDLGFGISCRVRLHLHGIRCIDVDKNGTETGTLIYNYVYDWLTARNSIFVRTMRDSTDHTYSAYVYSDWQLTACLNDDLVDAGYANPVT